VDPSLSLVHFVLGARIEDFCELETYLAAFGNSLQYMSISL
jgi:hypothetical protein